jgi:hypothetical protein
MVCKNGSFMVGRLRRADVGKMSEGNGRVMVGNLTSVQRWGNGGRKGSFYGRQIDVGLTLVNDGRNELFYGRQIDVGPPLGKWWEKFGRFMVGRLTSGRRWVNNGEKGCFMVGRLSSGRHWEMVGETGCFMFGRLTSGRRWESGGGKGRYWVAK